MKIHSDEQEGNTSPEYKGLQLLKHCPACKATFQQTDIHVVETYQNVHLLHVTCNACTHAILSLFTISQFGMGSVGMATDLSAADADRVIGTTPIHEDELFAFHTFLTGTQKKAHRIEDLFVMN
ncbi:MAG: hypothetical protein COV60_01335 [Candidatus Magasanikbacteria bacterium CG11_big_fil_rev_8_21_14_0_20_43_7]|uniref:Uncharacterized protein n=1 Tax=Candidatus Magasanikbacteria bacterium CG11_big_fil_rev_8_21_14_0_20_43_7 TaxID=1974654 RepID=A0A2H0N2X5_9BACT|nr:MAG: hypothetical protein COV60_01335 [Candidatus Magasanikbacteria bacterium CG11_big_fil_rev_8_21_14_0_20_43_7]